MTANEIKIRMTNFIRNNVGKLIQNN